MSILDQLILTFGNLKVLLLAVLCVIATILWRRPKNLPPGPTPLPIVGNIAHLMTDNRDFSLIVIDWSKKYGDVLTVYFGHVRAVALVGYETIHEALVKNSDSFSSRPPSSATYAPDGKSLGITQEPFGPKWHEHRKFAMTRLKDLGVGKRSMEGMILEEMRFVSEIICQKGGRAFSVYQILQNAVANVICSFVFGCRYGYDDTRFKDLLTAIHQISATKVVELMACAVRPLRLVPGVREGYRKYRYSQDRMFEHIMERIQEHEQTLDPENIRDFMDAFLLESRKRREDQNTTFTAKELAMTSFQFFLAGTDMSSTTLHWALLYMILHPDIQDKVQQEIDSVLGPDQEPSMVHRSQMPYTAATMAEIDRVASVAPFAAIHATSKDTTFRGYNIPKDTAVLANLWSVHYDPQLFPEPSKFDPTRFLDDTGNYVKRKEIIPFSIGRRSCPAEQLSRVELFLMFTSLLQRFRFKLPEGAPKPSEKGIYGIVRAPVPFKLTAEPRN